MKLTRKQTRAQETADAILLDVLTLMDEGVTASADTVKALRQIITVRCEAMVEDVIRAATDAAREGGAK